MLHFEAFLCHGLAEKTLDSALAINQLRLKTVSKSRPQTLRYDRDTHAEVPACIRKVGERSSDGFLKTHRYQDGPLGMQGIPVYLNTAVGTRTIERLITAEYW